jgi:hypothetical protein
MSPTLTRDSWKQILASAITIFEDLEKKGFGSPDVVIGRGTVLMFRFDHRLSKDIEFFTHDLQWVPLMTPRLNDTVRFERIIPKMIEQARSLLRDHHAPNLWQNIRSSITTWSRFSIPRQL